jgi:hypothetical protein
MNLLKIQLIIRNAIFFGFQAVFSPCTADALTGWLTSPETRRLALKPLKAANQSGKVAKIVNHGADSHYSRA